MLSYSRLWIRETEPWDVPLSNTTSQFFYLRRENPMKWKNEKIHRMSEHCREEHHHQTKKKNKIKPQIEGSRMGSFSSETSSHNQHISKSILISMNNVYNTMAQIVIRPFRSEHQWSWYDQNEIVAQCIWDCEDERPGIHHILRHGDIGTWWRRLGHDE